jgi:hypothetical protein
MQNILNDFWANILPKLRSPTKVPDDTRIRANLTWGYLRITQPCRASPKQQEDRWLSQRTMDDYLDLIFDRPKSMMLFRTHLTQELVKPTVHDRALQLF